MSLKIPFGVVSVKDQKLLRVIRAGSDPEQSAVSKDGSRLFVANEDTGELTVASVEDGHALPGNGSRAAHATRGSPAAPW